jgi:hypothetical protein
LDKWDLPTCKVCAKLNSVSTTLAQVLLEPDDRGRVNLSRVDGPKAQRYIAERLLDGSIMLRPAALLTERALESYVQARIAQATRDPERPLRSLSDYLAAHGVPEPSAERVAAVNARLAEKKVPGARTLGDVLRERRSAPAD